METEEIRSDRKGGKLILVTGIVFILLVSYYAVMALLAPSQKIKAINNEYGFKAPENSTIDSTIFSDSLYIRLNRERAFSKARITMAETDSISLSLNLSDSTASLEINGVTVHKTSVPFIRISRIFTGADEYAVTSMLSVPLTIKKDYATIQKEPLMLKIAPKDTSEYQPDILPDTTNTAPVNYILEAANGVRIYVYQVEDERGGALNRFLFDLSDRFRNSFEIARNIFIFKVPDYHPYIKIRLTKTDARLIYRGLPREGQIAIFR